MKDENHLFKINEVPPCPKKNTKLTRDFFANTITQAK